MLARPNTLVSILRGTTTNVHGDTVDSDTLAYQHIPMKISELNRLDTNPTSGRPRTIHHVVARCGADVDIQDGDRLLDEQTDLIYTLSAISAPRSAMGVNDLRLDLQQVN
jgi:hypothetical protein